MPDKLSPSTAFQDLVNSLYEAGCPEGWNQDDGAYCWYCSGPPSFNGRFHHESFCVWLLIEEAHEKIQKASQIQDKTPKG